MSTGSAVVAMPGNRVGASVATWLASAAAISAFDGTQPVFTHVPPNVPRSTITTDLPSVVARMAAANAPPPDPMIARSYLVCIPIPPGHGWERPLMQRYWTFQCRGRSRETCNNTTEAGMRIGELAE